MQCGRGAVGWVEWRCSAARELLVGDRKGHGNSFPPTPSCPQCPSVPGGSPVGRFWPWGQPGGRPHKEPRLSLCSCPISYSPHLWGHTLALSMSLKGHPILFSSGPLRVGLRASGAPETPLGAVWASQCFRGAVGPEIVCSACLVT